MTPMPLGLFLKKLLPKVGLAGYDILFIYFVVEAKNKNKQLKSIFNRHQYFKGFQSFFLRIVFFIECIQQFMSDYLQHIKTSFFILFIFLFTIFYYVPQFFSDDIKSKENHLFSKYFPITFNGILNYSTMISRKQIFGEVLWALDVIVFFFNHKNPYILLSFSLLLVYILL